MLVTKQELKVVLLGDIGVGKTCILIRFMKDEFNGKTSSTLGGVYNAKSVEYDKKTTTFKIWDTSGEERFKSVASAYFKDADAALLIYDTTKKASLNALDYWVRELREHDAEMRRLEMFLVGNKCDLVDNEEVPVNEAKSFGEKHKASLTLVSALTGEGVKELFEKVATNTIGREGRGKDGRITLGKGSKSGTDKSKCCK